MGADINSSAEIAIQGVAVVTGGGRGIGRAIARELARAGAAVAVVARSRQELAETVAQIAGCGGQCQSFVADIADAWQVREAFARLEATLGPVNILVNNAGVLGPLGPFAGTDMDQWWRTVEVNLRGPALGTQAVLPGMLARHAGRIINVASGAGTVPMAYFSSYITSKTAIIRFTESLAIETKAQGISVFSISPGTVHTRMADFSLDSPEGKKWIPWFRRIFDEGLNVPPERPARLVLELASGKADALSGRYFTVSDNLDAILDHAEEVDREKLYSLRLRTLPSRPAHPHMAAIRAAAESHSC